MSRVLPKDDSIHFANSSKIVEARNRIIHGYDTVADEVSRNALWEMHKGIV